MSKLLTFNPSSYIYLYDSPATKFYYLKQGTVIVKINGIDPMELLEGNFLGLYSFLSKSLRKESITAKSVCEVMELDRSDFMHLLKNDPAIVKSIISQHVDHIKKLNQKIESLHVIEENIPQKLYQAFIYYLENGDPHANEILERLKNNYPESDFYEMAKLLGNFQHV